MARSCSLPYLLLLTLHSNFKKRLFVCHFRDLGVMKRKNSFAQIRPSRLVRKTQDCNDHRSLSLTINQMSRFACTEEVGPFSTFRLLDWQVFPYSPT